VEEAKELKQAHALAVNAVEIYHRRVAKLLEVSGGR
jgi:hypothetical protein